MQPVYVATTTFMALCAIAALLAITGLAPVAIGISMYLGLWALIAAIVIALAVVVCIPRNEPKAFVRRHWLGLANGIVAAAFLVWAAIYVR